MILQTNIKEKKLLESQSESSGLLREKMWHVCENNRLLKIIWGYRANRKGVNFIPQKGRVKRKSLD